MTAKERLLQEAPDWTEEQSRHALAAATGRIIDDWGDLDVWAASTSLHALRMLDAEDAAAGFSSRSRRRDWLRLSQDQKLGPHRREFL